MVPIGVAAIHIDGTTIHTALRKPIRIFKTKLTLCHGKVKCSIRNHFSDSKVIIIDGISMVSNEL